MSLFLECHNDEAVVRALGIPARMIVHRDGKSRVAKALAKAPEGSVGMIDEDPHDSARIPDFDPYVLEERRPTFDLLKHRSQNKTVVRIKPRLEEWLLKAAGDSAVSMSRFYLPETASQLHLLKREKGDRIRKLVEHLIALKCASVVELGEVLRRRCSP
jgi:hypothetical protein